MSVESKVLELLKSKQWVTSGEFEDMFPKGSPGHMSWDQRLRDIRKDMLAKGGDVISRIKSGHTWEYSLVEPELKDTPLEEAIRHSNQVQEEKINLNAVNKQMEFAI